MAMTIQYVNGPDFFGNAFSTTIPSISEKTYDLCNIEPFNIVGKFLKTVPAVQVKSLKGFTGTNLIKNHIQAIKFQYDKILMVEPNYYIDCTCKLCETKKKLHTYDITKCKCNTCPSILDYIIEQLIKDIHGRAKKRGFFIKIFHRK